MQPKQKLVAGLLGIFLGAWGIHQFYLGDNKKGIIRIVVTLVTCGIGGIWGFIEGILILCGNINMDAQGNPLVYNQTDLKSTDGRKAVPAGTAFLPRLVCKKLSLAENTKEAAVFFFAAASGYRIM